MTETERRLHIAERVAAETEIARLRDELNAAIGYMTNAAIDLQTGAPKKTALDTINGGIARARRALEQKPDTQADIASDL